MDAKEQIFLRNDLSEKSLNMSSLRLTLSLPEHLWCLVTMVTCNAPTIDSIGEVGWSQRSLRVDNILSLILRHNSTDDLVIAVVISVARKPYQDKYNCFAIEIAHRQMKKMPA